MGILRNFQGSCCYMKARYKEDWGVFWGYQGSFKKFKGYFRFQRWFIKVSGVLWEYFKEISMKLKGDLSASITFQDCFKVISSMFQRSFKVVWMMFLGVSWIFQWSFKHVSEKFQQCVKSVLKAHTRYFRDF